MKQQPSEGGDFWSANRRGVPLLVAFSYDTLGVINEYQSSVRYGDTPRYLSLYRTLLWYSYSWYSSKFTGPVKAVNLLKYE